MKLQDVLLKAMAKKISWWAVAEIIGVSDRTMRRWRARLEEHGYSGLAVRRKGKASFRRVPLNRVEEVLRLFQEKYYDLNVRHFHEKLREPSVATIEPSGEIAFHARALEVSCLVVRAVQLDRALTTYPPELVVIAQNRVQYLKEIDRLQPTAITSKAMESLIQSVSETNP